MMGAKGLEFTIDPVSTFLIVPVLILASAIAAAVISLREIRNIRAYECLNTRE